jgi:DNA-binding NtrC family response regulator
VLQDRKVTRLGEAEERPFNARLLFATNAPIKTYVAEGKFRQDLMFRINTVEIEIPPLRRRPEDVEIFIDTFMSRYAEKYSKTHLSLSDEARQVLTAHTWPGNVRELQHTLERGVIMTEGPEIVAADFNLSTTPVPRAEPVAESFENLNIQEI